MIYHHVYKIWLLKLLNDYGNFKEAANHARMTQSAVSQNLTALEKAMQNSLVIRERGGVRLTEEGEALLRQVRPVLEILSDIETINNSGEKLSGSIRIGAYESIAVQLVRYLYETLQIKQPELKIEVVTGRTNSLIDMIRKGEIDMAFVINGKEENRIRVEKIASESLGVYVSESNPFFEQWQKDNRQILKIATLAPSQQDGYPLYYKRFVKSIPFDQKAALQSDSFETMRSVAEETNLAAILPHRVARKANKPLRCIWPNGSAEDVPGEHNFTFVWRENIDHNIVSVLSQVAKQVFI